MNGISNDNFCHFGDNFCHFGDNFCQMRDNFCHFENPSASTAIGKYLIFEGAIFEILMISSVALFSPKKSQNKIQFPLDKYSYMAYSVDTEEHKIINNREVMN